MAKETVQVALHNSSIIEKVKAKTADDPRMQKFILDILQLEANGKQYKSFYSKRLIT